MKAKKSLGQNFLKSALALRKIVEAGRLEADELILEIGPGKGALTAVLLASGARVLAVEKDPELFEFLRVKFEKEIESRSLVLVHDDILEFDVKNLKQFRYKIISNIPYNITGAILKKFLTDEVQPSLMVLMVQHEVAKRIMDSKGSLLSLSVGAYGQPKMIMKVAARYFSPQPKVDSAIILIDNISRELFAPKLVNLPGRQVLGRGVDEGKFWQIVRAGFAHKRKKLKGNLKQNLKNNPKKNPQCQSVSLTPKTPEAALLLEKRAEELSLFDWISLSR